LLTVKKKLLWISRFGIRIHFETGTQVWRLLPAKGTGDRERERQGVGNGLYGDDRPREIHVNPLFPCLSACDLDVGSAEWSVNASNRFPLVENSMIGAPAKAKSTARLLRLRSGQAFAEKRGSE
jgi:hypothetical protein